MKQPPQTDGSMCLPGEETWELWKQSPGGWQRASAAPGGPSDIKSATVFGYPVSAAFAVPIRAATADPELLPGLITFQLEKQGLNPETPVGRLTDYRVAERETTQTIVGAVVLNPALADDLPRGDPPKRFEVSPWLYDLPDQALVIWKELGRLVFAVTRREHPVYFHALGAPSLSVDAVQEMEHLMMPLFTQGILSELEEVVLWTPPDPGVEEALRGVFGVKPRVQARPAPVLPQEVSAIEPVSVAMGKIRSAKARKIRNIITTCAVAYLLIPGFFAVRYFMKQKGIAETQKRVGVLAANFGQVQPTLETARLMDGAINFDKYPIELLSQSLGPLFETATPGVRLLSFEVEKGQGENQKTQITIKAEAANSNTQAAIVYAAKFRSNPALKDFEWSNKLQSPKDGKVPFDIVGITRNDTTEAK